MIPSIFVKVEQERSAYQMCVVSEVTICNQSLMTCCPSRKCTTHQEGVKLLILHASYTSTIFVAHIAPGTYIIIFETNSL